MNGVVARPADPHVTIGGDIESVGDLIVLVGQVVHKPFLGIGIELPKHPRSEARHPDDAVGRHVQPAWTAERRIPFLDVAVGLARINAADTVAVELAVPNHTIDWRVVDAVGRDTFAFSFARGDGLVGA